MRLNPIPRLVLNSVVIGDPTRKPVDYLAAKVMFKAPEWAKPFPPEPEPAENIKRLKAELCAMRDRAIRAEEQVKTLQDRLKRYVELNRNRALQSQTRSDIKAYAQSVNDYKTQPDDCLSRDGLKSILGL